MVSIAASARRMRHCCSVRIVAAQRRTELPHHGFAGAKQRHRQRAGKFAHRKRCVGALAERGPSPFNNVLDNFLIFLARHPPFDRVQSRPEFAPQHALIDLIGYI